jgi:HD-like signal output (HDOD) protein
MNVAHQSNTDETRLAVQKLHELPAMSMNAQKFLTAVQNPEIKISELAGIIEQDPALLARIIGVANSAYFAYPEPIATAEQAIIQVLGLDTTKSLALSIILSGPFDATHCRGFHLEQFWLESVFTATLAQSLVPLLGSNAPSLTGMAYLAGLLHRIGLLAMVHLYPERVGEVIDACQQSCSPAARQQLEHSQLQMDHAEVGGWLGRKWHLPEEVVLVMEHYSDPCYRGDHWQLVQLVGFAARWAAAAVNRAEDEEYPCLSELQPLDVDIAPAGKRLARVALRLDELRELAKLFS